MSFAQTIETNRPSFSFSPNVVPRGVWQMETGITYTRINSNADVTSLPQAEFRYGIAEDVELFISSLGWVDAEGASGFCRPDVRCQSPRRRCRIDSRHGIPVQLSVPIGGNEVSTDSWDPGIAFIWSMSGGLGLSGTVLLSEFDGDFQVGNGLTLPFTINDTQSAFVEWEAQLLKAATPCTG